MRTIKGLFKKHHLLSVFIGILLLLLLRAGVAQATPLAHSKTWKVVASPNVGASDQLNGIARVPGTKNLWAVGYYAASNVSQTLTEFYG